MLVQTGVCFVGDTLFFLTFSGSKGTRKSTEEVLPGMQNTVKQSVLWHFHVTLTSPPTPGL